MRLLLLAWAVGSLLVGGTASAQSRPRVLLVIDQSDDRFAERIRAEVVGLGLEVLTVEPWRTGETIDSLEVVGRAEQVAAALRVVPSRRGVEVWMADQPAGRSLIRQLVVDERPGGPNEGLVALQTAELLRTSLLSGGESRTSSSAGTKPSGPAPIAAVTAPESPPPAPPRPKAGIAVGAGALGSRDGGTAATQLWVSFHRLLTGRFGLALDVSGPLWTGEIGGREGNATIATYLAGAALLLHFDAPASGLFFAAAGGPAVVRIVAAGQAALPELPSNTQYAVTSALYLRADAGFEATRWFRVGVRGLVGAAVPYVNVRFAGNQAGTLGWPFLGALLLAQLSW